MKIVTIADTHGQFPQLPAGDVLVHAGDATMMGTPDEVKEFDNWLGTLDFDHIIFVPGNHDFLFDSPYLNIRQRKDVLSNAIVLINEGIVISGVSFWGSPYTLPFGKWAFQKDDNQLYEMWKYIPDELDVLITHGPPKGIQDLAISVNTTGSPSLLERIREVKPKINVFGHIHEGYGHKYNREVMFANVSVVDECCKLVNKPLEIDI